MAGEIIEYDQKRMLLNFSVCDIDHDSKTMNVVYNGVRPDSLKEGAEVILEGSYEATINTFHAKTLLAKCSTKYEGK